MIHAHTALFIQLQLLVQLPSAFVAHAIRDNDKNTAFPAILPHKRTYKIFKEVLLTLPGIRSICLIRQRLIPLVGVIRQILVGINILHKVAQLFRLLIHADGIHIEIELAVIPVDAVGIFGIVLYHIINMRLIFMHGYALDDMVGVLHHPVLLLEGRCVMAARLSSLLADLRNGKSSNLLIQHAVFNLTDHPTD